MNVWCHLPTIFKRRQALRTAGLITLCVAITTTLFFIMPARAATGVNQTLSFQGRLQSPSGAIVPDGYYNIQFKLYQDGDGTAAGNTEGSPAGSLKWTENHVNNNANQGIRVKNGYFSVTLGSVTPFGSSVDWNQDTLWLSMNIAGTAANCTDFTSCSPDGEMLPMKRLTAVPYAIQAQNATTVGGMNASELIHNQNTAQQTASNFWISGTGRADTALQAPTVDTATAGTLTIGSVNATDITLAKDVTVAAGKSITLAGGNTASRPSSPSEGTMYFDTTTKQLLVYADGKWKSDSKTSTKVVAAGDSSQAIKDAADYVADGTGDQTEINAALTAAAGGKVYLTEGTYTINGAISVPNNTTLAGAGTGTIITIPNSFDTTINAITNTTTGGNGTGITIQDLKLDGNKANQASSSMNGIYFNGVGSGSGSSAIAGTTITRIAAVNWRSAGINLSSSANSSLTHTVTQNNSTGIGFSASPDNTITHNTAQGNTVYGFSFESNSNNNTMSHNISIENDTGFNISTSNGNSVTNNQVQGSSYGIFSGYSSNGMFSNNIVKDSSTQGMRFASSSHNTISNNQIIDSGSTAHNSALFLGASDGNTITGNSITDASATTTNYAIIIDDNPSDTNYLSNNTLGSGSINDNGTGTIYAGQLDANGKLINKSDAGMRVQTSTNNASALDIQNAAGTSALTVNTTNNSVLVAGTLDTTTATTLNLGTATATAINLGTTSGNILTTVNGRALVKSTAGNNSTTAFQVQNASATALLTADTTNMQVVIGSGSDTITLSSSGISFAGNARGTKQIRLAAEYENTVLDSGTGSNNSGTMVSTLDLTNRMNFYRWSATPASAQTYDIVTQVPIPQDFSAWAASNPLSITSRTNHTTDGAITLELRDSSGTERCSFTSLTMGSANSWITNTPSCLSSGTYTPGDYLTMRLRMSSKNNAQVDVGNIVLNYLSNK